MPDAVALRHKRFGIWEETTWAAYWRHVAATGHALRRLGVRPGDSVAILSDNRPEWVYADLGAQLIGARAVGIYQTNPPADVAYVLGHSKASVLFCEDEEQVDKAVAVAAEVPQLGHIVVFEPRGVRHHGEPQITVWQDFSARAQAALADEAPGWAEDELAARDPEAPSMVIYTSGTTGPPKGALISSRNALALTGSTLAALGLRDGGRERALSYLPLCHVAEKIFTLFQPLTNGAVVHFGESIETVREDLREVSPTVFLGVPRIWEKMHAGVTLKMKDASWLKRWLFGASLRWRQRVIARRRRSRRRWRGLRERMLWWATDLLVFDALRARLGLRHCRVPVSGAAPIAAELLAWFHAIGVPVLEGYGQTECAGVCHMNLPGADRLGTVGTPLDGVEHQLGPGGEVLVRGPIVFCGYLDDPEATAAAVDAEGWLHTGDVGTIDDRGALSITGRKKEILITAGGKNLSPEKIENALKLSPWVKEAVAIGDRRKFVSALIQIDEDTVADWAARKGIAFAAFADLAARPEVVALIAAAVKESNQHLAQVESVRAFRLLPKPLHQDDGELTPTQKVKRGAVMSRFDALITEMYGGPATPGGA